MCSISKFGLELAGIPACGLLVAPALPGFEGDPSGDPRPVPRAGGGDRSHSQRHARMSQVSDVRPHAMAGSNTTAKPKQAASPQTMSDSDLADEHRGQTFAKERAADRGEKWGQSSNMLDGTRLMILGEAHYCSPEHPEAVGQCVPETTVEVVEELAINGGRHRFFTGITQIVSGRPKWAMSEDEIKEVWAAIAFANYVPIFVATGPRVRPTKVMFESGHAGFVKMLADLEPDAIAVCGNDLWWWMRRGWLGEIPPVAETCRIGKAIASRITHPSGKGFSSTKTRPIIEALLQEARNDAAAT